MNFNGDLIVCSFQKSDIPLSLDGSLNTEVNIEAFKDYQLPTPSSIIWFSLIDGSDENESEDNKDEIAMDLEYSEGSSKD